MASVYPGAFDAFTNPLPTDKRTNHAAQHGNVNDAVEAIQAVLGLSPAGGSGTVSARIGVVEGGVLSRVSGPGSSTDNALVRFDGTDGKTVQNSGVTVDDSDVVSAADYVATTITVATGATDTVTMPDGLVQQVTGPISWQSARQVSGVTINGDTLQSANDELAPIWLTRAGTTEIQGGNHQSYTWVQSAGGLTTADIGKVWTSGSSYTTLLDVTGGNAVFSALHNLAVTTITSTAPTGTWTSSGNPSVTWSSPTFTSNLLLSKSVTDTGVNWDGSPRVAMRRVVQVLTGYDTYILAQQASVGTKITVASCSTIGTLTSEWRWYGNQPGVIVVDVSYDAAVDTAIYQWSGIQFGAAAGTSYQAVVGVTGTLSTWATISTNTTVLTGEWVTTPPRVMMTRGTFGGVAGGVLASSQDLATRSASAATVSSGKKSYPIAVDGSNGAISAGATAWVRGFRSLTTDTSDRHFHVVTDPGTGVTHWWLVAGSTGTATHPALSSVATGARLVTARGTAVVDSYIDSGAVTVTTAGWAEGTVDRVGVPVTTGDVGTVAAAMLAPDSVTATKLADAAITDAHVSSAAAISLGKISGAGPGRRFTSGLYYLQDCATGADSTSATLQNYLVFQTFTVGVTTTFDRIGCEVTTLASGSTVRLGIYGTAATGMKPGSLLLDAGTIDSTATGEKEITISQQLAPGIYWLAYVAQGGTPTLRTSAYGRNPLLGAASLGTYSPSALYTSSVTGALPASPNGIVSELAQFKCKIFLRAA